MPLYHVHFAAEPPASYPPVSEMMAVTAVDPLAAVESLLESGRVQNPSLRWAGVVTDLHPNGVPAKVLLFAIHAEQGPSIDWNVGSEI